MGPSSILFAAEVSVRHSDDLKGKERRTVGGKGPEGAREKLRFGTLMI